MARAIVVQAGPLAASSATKISLSQKAAGAQFLVLNGAAGSAVANNICLSQSPSGASNLTINGSLASGGVATLNNNLPVYITSGGDDSGNTFTITGTAYGPSGGPFAVTETITGSNTSVVSSAKKYYAISQIAISGASGGTVTVGTYNIATLDTARRVLITNGGNDSSITFAVTGTNWAGDSISETITGSNGVTVASVLDYLTVTSIKTSAGVATTVSIGTNGVAGSPWARLDEWAAMGPTALQIDGSSGTAVLNWTVQQTLNDPNTLTNPVTVDKLNWINHPDSNLVASTVATGVQGNYAYPPKYARVVLNSATNPGAVLLTILQNYQK